jgi:hypothetical protein
MIKTKEEGLIDENLLEGAEITAFIKFLQVEKERHQIDILMIEKTIENLIKHNSSSNKDYELHLCGKCGEDTNHKFINGMWICQICSPS